MGKYPLVYGTNGYQILKMANFLMRRNHSLDLDEIPDVPGDNPPSSSGKSASKKNHEPNASAPKEDEI